MSTAELVETGHFLEAVERLEPVVKANPRNAPALWLLSRAKSWLGELDEAFKLIDEAIAINDKIAAYHVQAAAVAGRMALKASLLKQLGLARRVKKELEEATQLDPRNSDAQYGLMMYYFAAPSLLGGDKNKARQTGGELAKAVPVAGLFYQGRLAHEMKEQSEEEAYYRQSFMLNPLFYDAVEGLMNFYLEARDFQKTEIWACQAVHADPTRSQGWAVLAKLRVYGGSWTEAVAIARQYEAVNPRDLGPYFAIAAAAVERNEQLPMAEEYLGRYLSQPAEGNQPTHAMGHWQLGLAYERMGRKANAVSELQSAIKMDPSLDGAKADLKRINAK